MCEGFFDPARRRSGGERLLGSQEVGLSFLIPDVLRHSGAPTGIVVAASLLIGRMRPLDRFPEPVLFESFPMGLHHATAHVAKLDMGELMSRHEQEFVVRGIAVQQPLVEIDKGPPG